MARLTRLALFYRSLAQLLGAGIPILRALESCRTSQPNAIHLLTPLSYHVEHGSTLAEAMAAARPGIFPPHHIKLIAIAEASGRTETALLELAGFTEQLHAMRRTILVGLILPALILHAAAFIVPLPALLISGHLGSYLIASVGFLAAIWLAVLIVYLLVQIAPPVVLDAGLRLLPVIGRTWRELDYWRVVSSMEMLTNAGLGVIQSLRLCADICRSPRIATALRNAADAAEQRGEPVSTSLAQAREFPDELTSLWATGEQSGRLDEMFTRLAKYFADRCQRRMVVLGTLLPWLVYALVSAYLVVQIFRMALNYINLLNSI